MWEGCEALGGDREGVATSGAAWLVSGRAWSATLVLLLPPMVRTGELAGFCFLQRHDGQGSASS